MDIKIIGIDIITGSLAALSITPIVNIVDSSITSSQSGKNNVINTIKIYTSLLFKSPITFMNRSIVAWSFSVYCITYSINNIVETVCEVKGINNFYPKLFLVSFSNISISLMKEAAFAKNFGIKLPEKLPRRSFLTWIVRDVLAITNVFIMPERIVKMIQKRNEKRFSKEEVEKKNVHIRSKVQMSVPFVNILLLSPINLLGLDFYNHNQSSFGNRLRRVFINFPNVLPVTFLRMTAAYGIGGCNNINIKYYFRKKFVRRSD